MLGKQVRIDICIATYKRPALLKQLLISLFEQQIDDSLSFQIIVVDNDKDGSAKHVIDKLIENAPVNIIYDIEPQQNISLVRNKAVSYVTGDYLIFIDDDEYAEPNWIEEHFNTAKEYDADVVFGPVLSDYPVQTPDWIKKGKFFDRMRYKTGTEKAHGATNNTLVKVQCLENMKVYFDPAFGLTGGGDTEFFWRMGNNGAKMIWCDSAIVSESVLPNRMNLKWLTRRAYRGGQMFPRVFCRNMPFHNKLFWIVKRFLFLIVACLYLPIAACQDKSKWGLAMQKVYTCLGHLTGFTSFHYQEYK